MVAPTGGAHPNLPQNIKCGVKDKKYHLFKVYMYLKLMSALIDQRDN